jgi:hypothetical protein
MHKDLLVGGIDNYSWQQIAPWVLSIKETGFTGDIWLVAYRIADDVIATLDAQGVNVYKVDHDPFMRPINHSAHGPTSAHNLRFYHIWELLSRLNAEEYKYVITTDVRDVVFQTDPSIWLRNNMGGEKPLISPSECILYKNEEWGKQNFLDSYGPVIWELEMQDKESCNVGTIAGTFDAIKRACLQIYEMSLGRSYPSDQSSWNLLTHVLWKSEIRIAYEFFDWAAQIGTTLDPTKPWLWERLTDAQPVIRPDNMVVSSNGVPYVIVHQWDRHPHLRDLYTQKYHV